MTDPNINRLWQIADLAKNWDYGDRLALSKEIATWVLETYLISGEALTSRTIPKLMERYEEKKR